MFDTFDCFQMHHLHLALSKSIISSTSASGDSSLPVWGSMAVYLACLHHTLAMAMCPYMLRAIFLSHAHSCLRSHILLCSTMESTMTLAVLHSHDNFPTLWPLTYFLLRWNIPSCYISMDQEFTDYLSSSQGAWGVLKSSRGGEAGLLL